MKFGSMFSGVGGFDLGLEAAGMACSFQIEWDKACQNVLNYHWPDVPKWHDISGVNGANLPQCDLVAFGSPCQDLSVAGGRKGLEGKRSGLFYEGLRVIGELHAIKPIRYIVWENVPGALNSNKGNDFGAVIDSLAELGAMAIEWAVLDAQNFGVAQRRRRLFVIAELSPRTAQQGTSKILSVKQGSRRDNQTSNQTRKNYAARTNGSIRDDSQPTYVKARRAQTVDDYETWVQSGISPTLNTFDNFGEARATVLMPFVFDGTRNRDMRVSESGVWTLKARMGTGGGQVPMLATPGEINLGVRRLMPIECERLMGWPDDHTRFKAPGVEQPDTTRYKQIGNGVASPVAQWIGEQIMIFERLKND